MSRSGFICKAENYSGQFWLFYFEVLMMDPKQIFAASVMAFGLFYYFFIDFLSKVKCVYTLGSLSLSTYLILTALGFILLYLF